MRYTGIRCTRYVLCGIRVSGVRGKFCPVYGDPVYETFGEWNKLLGVSYSGHPCCNCCSKRFTFKRSWVQIHTLYDTFISSSELRHIHPLTCLALLNVCSGHSYKNVSCLYPPKVWKWQFKDPKLQKYYFDSTFYGGFSHLRAFSHLNFVTVFLFILEA